MRSSVIYIFFLFFIYPPLDDRKVISTGFTFKYKNIVKKCSKIYLIKSLDGDGNESRTVYFESPIVALKRFCD